MDKIGQLEPWLRGPFELIRHAYGHFQSGDDTDRRIALIGFDNAIEVCIDVYLRLHPKIRNGVEIPQADVARAQVNYHTKLGFLDKHITDRQIRVSVSMTAVIWYHQLRNELYHSGNGMVPEQHVVEGALTAALSVFEALFAVDLRLYLAPPPGVSFCLPSVGELVADADARHPTAASGLSASGESTPQNDEMDFLRVFAEFEEALTAATRKMFDKTGSPGLLERWHAYAAKTQQSKKATQVVRAAVQFRNGIVHGGERIKLDDEFVDVYVSLSEINDEIRRRVADEVFKVLVETPTDELMARVRSRTRGRPLAEPSDDDR